MHLILNAFKQESQEHNGSCSHSHFSLNCIVTRCRRGYILQWNNVHKNGTHFKTKLCFANGSLCTKINRFNMRAGNYSCSLGSFGWEHFGGSRSELIRWLRAMKSFEKKINHKSSTSAAEAVQFVWQSNKTGAIRLLLLLSFISFTALKFKNVHATVSWKHFLPVKDNFMNRTERRKFLLDDWLITDRLSDVLPML